MKRWPHNPLSDQVLAEAAATVFPNTQGFIPGWGNLNPRLILVGEAPGETEVTSLRPFTGRAGAKLDLMLAAMTLTRADVFITMSFHRRPTRPRNDKLANRPPTKAEMLAEGWLLDAELAALPEVPILAMGNTALGRLDRGRVGDYHGQVRKIQRSVVQGDALVPGPACTLAVCAHPAALLYRKATQVQTLEDLRLIKDALEV